MFSLGVVFVSATDSTDLVNDNANLVDVAKELGLLTHDHQEIPEDSDFHLAQQLQESEQEVQLLRDQELAEQLQMRENTYRTPRYTFMLTCRYRIACM